MTCYFITDTPQSILNKFNKRIEQEELKGSIPTWKRSDDRMYYTHASAEWNKKAWFKPSIKSGRLTFYIVKPKNSNITTTVYGYYHGHLIETFLNHFDEDFAQAEATARPAKGETFAHHSIRHRQLSERRTGSSVTHPPGCCPVAAGQGDSSRDRHFPCAPLEGS
jgi:hypothetical protein